MNKTGLTSNNRYILNVTHLHLIDIVISFINGINSYRIKEITILKFSTFWSMSQRKQIKHPQASNVSTSIFSFTMCSKLQQLIKTTAAAGYRNFCCLFSVHFYTPTSHCATMTSTNKTVGKNMKMNEEVSTCYLKKIDIFSGGQSKVRYSF